MEKLVYQLQATLIAHDAAAAAIRETDKELTAARSALDAHLRARNDSDDIIDTMTEEARHAHIERAEQAIADALAAARDPLGYFCDKCGAV